MPNFTPRQNLSPEQAKKRLQKAVLSIRKKQALTPILIIEHARYSDGIIQSDRFGKGLKFRFISPFFL
jgi:hypothetical protein